MFAAFSLTLTPSALRRWCAAYCQRVPSVPDPVFLEVPPEAAPEVSPKSELLPPSEPLPPKLKPLSFNHWLFVEACLETIKTSGHIDRITAYRKVYPKAKYTSAAANAHELLKKPEVKTAIEERLRYEGLTKESILSVMLDAVERARVAGQFDTVLNGCMKLMVARGEVIEKKEVKTLSDDDEQRIADLVEEHMQALLSKKSNRLALPLPVVDQLDTASYAQSSLVISD